MKVMIGRDPLNGFLKAGGEYPILDMLAVRSVNLLYIINEAEGERGNWTAFIERKKEWLESELGTVKLTPAAKPYNVFYEYDGEKGAYDIRTRLRGVIGGSPTANPARTLQKSLATILAKRYGLDSVKVMPTHIEFEVSGAQYEIVDDITGGFVYKSPDTGVFRVFRDNRATYEEVLG